MVAAVLYRSLASSSTERLAPLVRFNMALTRRLAPFCSLRSCSSVCPEEQKQV